MAQNIREDRSIDSARLMSHWTHYWSFWRQSS